MNNVNRIPVALGGCKLTYTRRSRQRQQRVYSGWRRIGFWPTRIGRSRYIASRPTVSGNSHISEMQNIDQSSQAEIRKRKLLTMKAREATIALSSVLCFYILEYCVPWVYFNINSSNVIYLCCHAGLPGPRGPLPRQYTESQYWESQTPSDFVYGQAARKWDQILRCQHLLRMSTIEIMSMLAITGTLPTRTDFVEQSPLVSNITSPSDISFQAAFVIS